MGTRKRALLAGCTLLALTLAACSSGSKASSGASTASSGGGTTTSAASGTPIVVGFLNQSQGAAAYPDFGAGADPAVSYVNSHGGINGRPLKLDSCQTDGSATASVNCANKFVQDKVLAVLMGIDLASDSALPILAGAGIPLVGRTAFGPKQSDSPDAFFFGAANDGYWATPFVTLSEKLGVKSTAIIVPDSAFYRHYVTTDAAPAAKNLGIDLAQNYYSASTPNYTSTFATATSKHPDAVLIYGSEDECTGLVSAAKTLGYQGKVFAGTCSAFLQHAPDAAEGVLTDGDLYLPDDLSKVPSRQAGELQIYLNAMKGAPTKYIDAFSEITFSGVMDFATTLKTIKGDITSAGILSAIGAIRGAPSFMGGTMTRDGKQWPGQSSVCSAALITFQVTNGKRVPITDFVSAASYVH